MATHDPSPSFLLPLIPLIPFLLPSLLCTILGLTAKPISYVLLFFYIIKTVSGMYQFLQQCDKNTANLFRNSFIFHSSYVSSMRCQDSLIHVICIHGTKIGCCFHSLESWWWLWQQKGDRVGLTLTLQGIWHVSVWLTVFFPKASHMAIPNFWQLPESGQLKYIWQSSP